jgi:hypothetical protein
VLSSREIFAAREEYKREAPPGSKESDETCASGQALTGLGLRAASPRYDLHRTCLHMRAQKTRQFDRSRRRQRAELRNIGIETRTRCALSFTWVAGPYSFRYRRTAFGRLFGTVRLKRRSLGDALRGKHERRHPDAAQNATPVHVSGKIAGVGKDRPFWQDGVAAACGSVSFVGVSLSSGFPSRFSAEGGGGGRCAKAPWIHPPRGRHRRRVQRRWPRDIGPRVCRRRCASRPGTSAGFPTAALEKKGGPARAVRGRHASTGSHARSRGSTPMPSRCKKSKALREQKQHSAMLLGVWTR